MNDNDSSISNKNGRYIIITGLSGSGKTVVLKALEDLGYFCVDNLPVSLLPKLIELKGSSRQDMNIALVMDLRGEKFVSDFPVLHSRLLKQGIPLELIFLEADEETIIKRYSLTRRHHPLAGNSTLLEGIRREAELLKQIKLLADFVIDTSNYNVHQLRELILETFAPHLSKENPILINLISFGFKYGLPLDADIILDARFLPNPYFIPELSELSGLNPKVANYVLSHKEALEFLNYITKLIQFVLPLYEREGKMTLSIAIGCTGGYHRSVTLINELAKRFKTGNYRLSIIHRDINK